MNQSIEKYLGRLRAAVAQKMGHVEQRLDWNKEPVRREKIIFFVAIFIFFLVFMRSCWYPSSEAISELKSEIEVSKEHSSYLQQVLKTKSTAGQDEIATNTAKFMQYSDWAKRLATDPDSVLMTELSNPDMLRGIKIGNVDLKESALPGGVVKKDFKFQLIGPFSSIGTYLVRLEKLPLLLVVDTITIREATVGEGDPVQRVAVDVGGTVYGWK